MAAKKAVTKRAPTKMTKPEKKTEAAPVETTVKLTIDAYVHGVEHVALMKCGNGEHKDEQHYADVIAFGTAQKFEGKKAVSGVEHGPIILSANGNFVFARFHPDFISIIGKSELMQQSFESRVEGAMRNIIGNLEKARVPRTSQLAQSTQSDAQSTATAATTAEVAPSAPVVEQAVAQIPSAVTPAETSVAKPADVTIFPTNAPPPVAQF